MSELLNVAVSLLPVIGFLASLLLLDSFKLVSLRAVLLALAAGAVSALAAMFVNGSLIGQLDIELSTYTRYVAPVVEELLKGIYIAYLLLSRRVGFMVDAAIFGFALGAGFAVLENVYYLQTVDNPHIFLWILRGFGTASMHGGTTAILAILAKHMMERDASARWTALGLSVLVAIALHSVFNHFILPPVIMTAVLMVFFPLLLVTVFARSEKATRQWLGEGLDTDMELWNIISSGKMTDSRIGQYLESLTDRFPATVVTDMLCYLQMHIEVSVQAKGVLLAREAGLEIGPDPGLPAKLEELRYLENSMGKTGYLAILPFLRPEYRELWHINLLGR